MWFVVFLPQDYELQLMTYKAFVESQQKSPGKRRRMLSSSDAITQEVRGWGRDACAVLPQGETHLLGLLARYYQVTSRKLPLGVPVMAQQKQIQLGTMRLLVQFLASLSGLRIRHCHEVWCRW